MFTILAMNPATRGNNGETHCSESLPHATCPDGYWIPPPMPPDAWWFRDWNVLMLIRRLRIAVLVSYTLQIVAIQRLLAQKPVVPDGFKGKDMVRIPMEDLFPISTLPDIAIAVTANPELVACYGRVDWSLA
jgi:hypothetical protein